MGRGAGTGRSPDQLTLVESIGPGGIHYWHVAGDLGGGYLVPDKYSTWFPLSYIYGLAAVPTGASTQAQGRPQEVATAALGDVIKVIYGKDRVSGSIFFGPYVTNGQNDITFAVGFGEGECDSLVSIETDDGVAVTLGVSPYGANGTWTFHPGVDAPGSADALLYGATGDAGATFERYPGLCYLAAKFTYSPTLVPNFPRLKYTIKARKVYDSRLDSTNGGAGTQRFTDPTTWAWSENPALCYADYLTNPYFGRGVPPTMVNWAAVAVAADYCDVDISGRKRFTFNTTLGRNASHDENIDFMRSHFRASRWFMSNGKFTFYIDKPGASVKTFDESTNCSVVSRGRRKTSEIPLGIRYNWIDPSRDYQPATALEPKDTSLSGADPRIADYNGDGCRNPGQADSQAVYYKKKRQLDMYVAIACERAEGLAMEIGDICTLNLQSLGLSGYLARIIAITKRANGKYLLIFEPYDAAVYVDSIKTIETKPPSSLPDPSAAPPNISSGTVTWTEELYQQQDNHWLSRGILGFTTPTYPYTEAIEVWVTPPSGGGSKFWFETSSSPTVTPTLWETGNYTLTLYVRNFAKKKSTGTTIVVAVNGVSGTVPEIADAIVTAADNDAISTAYWPTPVVRSSTLYGSAFWTGTNLGAPDYAKVNDGILNVACFNWNVAADSTLQFDAGVGQTKAFREVVIYYSTNAGWSTGIVEWSDNGTAWNFLNTGELTGAIDVGGGIFRRRIKFDNAGVPAGAHRYWRWRKNASVALDITIYEFWPQEFGAAYNYTREFRVYAVPGNPPSMGATPAAKKLYDTISISAIPTSSKPFNVDPLTIKNPPNGAPANLGGGKSSFVYLFVSVVSTSGVESDGVLVSSGHSFAASGNPAAGSVLQTENQITLANGLNSDIQLPTGPGQLNVIGPTAAFTLGGFSSNGGAPVGGERVTISYDGTQACTIKQEDASSTAALRIRTLTGADVVLAAGKFQLEFIYSAPFGGAPLRWILLAARDSTGAVGPMLGSWLTGTLPANYAVAADPPAGDSTQKVATTNFVQGEGMQKITALSPNAVSSGGVSEPGVVPSGFDTILTSTFSTTDVNIINITGKGALRFLSGASPSSAVTGTITVVVDGTTVGTFGFSSGGSADGMFWAFIGSIVASKFAANDFFTSCVPEEGITFKTSLTVKLKTSNASFATYARYAYALY